MQQNPDRTAAQGEARNMANRARLRANVGVKLIADALRLHRVNAQRRLDGETDYQHLSLADMIMLARAADTREFVACLLAELQLVLEPHDLRLCDVVSMSKRPELSEIMRMVVRPAAEQLFPDQMRPTCENENAVAIVVAVARPAAATTEVAVAPRRRAKR